MKEITEKIKIMSCEKVLNRKNRKLYGIFWRFKRKTIALEEINDKLGRILRSIE